MQFISVLFYVVLTSFFGIAKSKLDLTNSFELKHVDSHEKIIPDEDLPMQLKEHYPDDKPSIYRLKRSDNVIEEENLGTTMSWYKVTWLYSKLDDNDSKFRNINS